MSVCKLKGTALLFINLESEVGKPLQPYSSSGAQVACYDKEPLLLLPTAPTAKQHDTLRLHSPQLAPTSTWQTHTNLEVIITN